MIPDAVLEICQSEPTRPDEGVIEPFSDREKAAIKRYNRATLGVDDTLDPDPYFPAGSEGLLRTAYVYMNTLTHWFAALDALDGDLRDVEERRGNAATRLLEYEANRLVQTSNRVHQAIAVAVVGERGVLSRDGYLVTSNGHIAVDGSAAG